MNLSKEQFSALMLETIGATRQVTIGDDYTFIKLFYLVMFVLSKLAEDNADISAEPATIVLARQIVKECANFDARKQKDPSLNIWEDFENFVTGLNITIGEDMHN